MYPKDPAEVAAKRLILENVLLLSNRRTPTNHLFDINNVEAVKLITDTFRGGLQNIFNYYIAKAHHRRGNAVSQEKMSHREWLRANGHSETDKEAVALVLSPVKQQNLQYLKNLMVAQREMISYKEYLLVSKPFWVHPFIFISFAVRFAE